MARLCDEIAKLERQEQEDALAALLGRPLGPVDRRALELWQERERGWEPRLRRMLPDEIDLCGAPGDPGAWERVRHKAWLEIVGKERA